MAQAVLADRDLLPHILAFLAEHEECSVRLLNKGIRAAHEVQASFLRARCHEEDAIAEQEVSLHRMLARGCRPNEVIIDVEAAGDAQELQRLGLRLLRPFAEVPRTVPLPTTDLKLDANLLTATTASELLTQAFPELTYFVVWCEGVPVGGDLAGALKSLLRAGQAKAPGPQPSREPVLPRLETVELVMHGVGRTDYQPLPPALAAVLGNAAQLRQLRLDFNLDTAAAVADIAGLTGLESLSVGFVREVHLRPLLQPLTALTCLTADVAPAVRSGAMEGLVKLVELHLVGLTELDVTALSHLPHLIKLHCGALVAPAAGAVAGAAAPEGGWPLPPGLRELALTCQEPQELPRPLRGSPQGIVAGAVGFDLLADVHTLPSGELMPETEAALCAAAGALAQLMAPAAVCTVGVTVLEGDHPGVVLRPVGGAAAAGPGRRSHTPWLEALGALRPSGLVLAGVALSHQDLDTISRMTSLTALDLRPPCVFPASALCELFCLPALSRLGIDCSGWVARTGPGDAMREPPEARGVLLALCCNKAGPQPKVELSYSKSLRAGPVAELAAMVTALRAELEALGMEDSEQLSLAPV